MILTLSVLSKHAGSEVKGSGSTSIVCSFGLRKTGGGMKPIKSIDDPRYVKAMSHPLRVRILAMLDERKASPNQLAGWLGASLGTVAYHVRTLQQLGLIELVDETRVRGAVEHHYRAKARPNVTADGWAAAAPIARQAAVGSSLDVIGEYARVSAAAGGFDRPEAQLQRTLMRLDARGFAQLSKACDKLLEQAQKIEASAADRLARGKKADGAIETGLGLMLFEAARLSGRDDGGKRSSRRSRKGASGGV
jgi:DNA-binding transcriptional ArsR family regulator